MEDAERVRAVCSAIPTALDCTCDLALVNDSASSKHIRFSTMAKISAGIFACIAYVFQWGYDGKQPSIVSLGPISRLSGNQMEDDRSSVCVLCLACIGSSQPS